MAPASPHASPPSKSGPAPKDAERMSNGGQGSMTLSRDARASSSTAARNKAAIVQEVENPFDWHAPGRESAVAKLVAELEAKTRLARSASASASEPAKPDIASPLDAVPFLATTTSDATPCLAATSSTDVGMDVQISNASTCDSKTAPPATPAPTHNEIIEDIEIASASFPVSENNHSSSPERRPLVELSPSRKQQTGSPTDEVADELPAAKSPVSKADMDSIEPGETLRSAEIQAGDGVAVAALMIEQQPSGSPTVSRSSPYSSKQRKDAHTLQSITDGVEQSEDDRLLVGETMFAPSGGLAEIASAPGGSLAAERPKKTVKKQVDRAVMRKAALAALSTMPLRSAASRTYGRKPTAASSTLPEKTSPALCKQNSDAKISQCDSSTSAASSNSTNRASRLSNMYGFSMQLDGASLPVERSASHKPPAITGQLDQLAEKRGDIWANGCSSSDLAEMEIKAKEEEEESGLGHSDKDASASGNEVDRSNGKMEDSATTKAEKKKRKRKGNSSDAGPEASDGAESAARATSAIKPKRKKKGKKETSPTYADTDTQRQEPDTPALISEQTEQPDTAPVHGDRDASDDNAVSDPGHHADTLSTSQAINTA